MQVWRINLRTKTGIIEETPRSWERLGGRGLIARILLDEVPGTCNPLGPENKLIFAPGLLVGHRLSSFDRISAGGKSPLTKGVKESNAGGTTGYTLTFLGIKALIFEDQPVTEDWSVIRIGKDGVHFDSADEITGQGVYASAGWLVNRYGKKVSIALIGPAGEMCLQAAGIFNLDKDEVPARVNARGGLGALMGSKRIKAIVIDPSGGSRPPLVDPIAFKQAQKAYTELLQKHPQTAIYHDFSTPGIAGMANAFGALPVHNFSRGQFDQIDQINGEHFRQTILQRGGKADPSHTCMAGCIIKCSNVYTNIMDEIIVSPLEYETIGLLGSNLGIGSLDDIGRLNWVVNDLGLDTIDTGAALGVAAEAGLMPYGDTAKALELLEEIRLGTQLGRQLGSGVQVAGEYLGVERIPAVKGQAMSAYDGRAIKGTGVTYATNPQGADHTAGLTIRLKIDHLDPKGQAAHSLKAQINMAGYDTLGACIFAGFGISLSPTILAELLRARYGWDEGAETLQVLGRETLRLERQFNHLAGFTAADDRMPAWMEKEPVAPTGAVFDVPDEDLDGIFQWT